MEVLTGGDIKKNDLNLTQEGTEQGTSPSPSDPHSSLPVQPPPLPTWNLLPLSWRWLSEFHLPPTSSSGCSPIIPPPGKSKQQSHAGRAVLGSSLRHQGMSTQEQGKAVGEMFGIQYPLECYVGKCEGALKRHPSTTSITLVTYTEHLRANVNTVLTPRLKLITATTAPPVSSKMCPLNYFSRSDNGFMVSHASFHFIQ